MVMILIRFGAHHSNFSKRSIDPKYSEYLVVGSQIELGLSLKVTHDPQSKPRVTCRSGPPKRRPRSLPGRPL